MTYKGQDQMSRCAQVPVAQQLKQQRPLAPTLSYAVDLV
jgi:hypothetical protein